MGPFGIHLSLTPGRPPLGCPDVNDIFAPNPGVPPDTPLKDTPGWQDPQPPGPPTLVTGGGTDIALDRLESNGVAYRNDNAGPKERKVKATLVETAVDQGLLAPVIVDQNNYAGIGYDPDTGNLVAEKKVGGVTTPLGTAAISPVSGTTEIGAIHKGGRLWMTRDGQSLGNFSLGGDLQGSDTRSGLIARGAPGAGAWLRNYSVALVRIGYGRGWGFAYGGSAAA